MARGKVRLKATVTGGLTAFGDRLDLRLNEATREAVLETAEKVVARARELTYVETGGRWNRQTGRAGEGWHADPKEIEYRSSAQGRAFAGGNAYSVPVRNMVEYIAWLEEGFTDRGGVFHSGGHMLKQAMAEHAEFLPRAIYLRWYTSTYQR